MKTGIRNRTQIVVAVIIFFCTSCASPPWIKHRMEVAPDNSCQTGNEAGYNIYIWRCYNNQKIVVFQKSAGLYVFSAQKQVVECGAETEFEKEIEFAPTNSIICKRKPPEWILSNEAE